MHLVLYVCVCEKKLKQPVNEPVSCQTQKKKKNELEVWKHPCITLVRVKVFFCTLAFFCALSCLIFYSLMYDRFRCGWIPPPSRSSSSGKSISAKWWEWRSAGLTAPRWESSIRACLSKLVAAEGSLSPCWRKVVCSRHHVLSATTQWHQQDQWRHRGPSRHFYAAFHHLCVRLLHRLCERMEVNACDCGSKSTNWHWSWPHGSGETLRLNMLWLPDEWICLLVCMPMNKSCKGTTVIHFHHSTVAVFDILIFGFRFGTTVIIESWAKNPHLTE